MFLYPNDFSFWQPADSIAIFKLLSLKMTGQIDAEITYAKALLALENREMLSALLPDSPGNPINKLENAKKFSSNFLHNLEDKKHLRGLFSFPSLELAGASNVFGATKERSAAGGPLLANDPHFGLSAPSLFSVSYTHLTLPTNREV